MSMKHFEVAAKHAEDKDAGNEGVTTFTVGEEKGKKFTIRAYKPSTAQIAVLMAETGRGSGDDARVAGFINFCMAIMDDASADYLAGRLLDRKDPFEVEHLQTIIESLLEEWGANPTDEPSGSSPSAPSSGPSSTPDTRQSIF